MSKHSIIHITYLYGCPYSEKAEEILKENNIAFYINKIDRQQTKLYTEKYNFPTFPHITLKDKNNDIIYTIGGCSDLIEFMNTFHKKPLDNDNINMYIKKYNTKKHNILRTISIINNVKK